MRKIARSLSSSTTISQIKNRFVWYGKISPEDARTLLEHIEALEDITLKVVGAARGRRGEKDVKNGV